MELGCVLVKRPVLPLPARLLDLYISHHMHHLLGQLLFDIRCTLFPVQKSLCSVLRCYIMYNMCGRIGHFGYQHGTSWSESRLSTQGHNDVYRGAIQSASIGVSVHSDHLLGTAIGRTLWWIRHNLRTKLCCTFAIGHLILVERLGNHHSSCCLDRRNKNHCFAIKSSSRWHSSSLRPHVPPECHGNWLSRASAANCTRLLHGAR